MILIVRSRFCAAGGCAQPARRRPATQGAWTVIAHTRSKWQLRSGRQGYKQVLALLPDKDPARNELTERLAASITTGRTGARAGQIGATPSHTSTGSREAAPLSSVRQPQYDAAAALIALKDLMAPPRR